MPWNQSDYPASMKNLAEHTRKKAIEIGNALLNEGYEESRAIPIAISQAEKYTNSDEQAHYVIQYREEEWKMMKEGHQHVILSSGTKEELVQKAKPYVQDKGGVLTIYKLDGSVEDTLYEG
ncbi:DUF2188 domain-containing protein [Bacillus coahuilensis]|uniref:DUF2188 domain-containing protein n=1 Tax=Bacillus coahuilensis TaxID=408580 RepID=UPI00018508EB|nr:DUF2188 domain-containing protein [Bacillus coahuilensis]